MLALDINLDKRCLLKDIVRLDRERPPTAVPCSASDHLQLLLLLCGDIELNPGPSKAYFLYQC